MVALGTQIILDANIFLSIFLGELLQDQAMDLLQTIDTRQIEILAPELMRYEIPAVLRRGVYQGRLSHEEGLDAIKIFFTYPIKFHIDEDLLLDAYHLAHMYNLPTAYDAQYLALAKRLNCQLWTADRRFYNALSTHLDWLHWLGNWTLNT